MQHMIVHLKDVFPVLGEDGKDPFVEVYLPDNMISMGRAEQKHPCMVICPGGGYHFCSEREADPIAARFYALGCNVFILNYSCAPHRFPAALREAAAVMELIHQNQDRWHCDTDRVAILGFSAGGHLAAHYTNAYDIPEVRSVFPESKPVQASVLCYPVIIADPAHGHMGSFQNLLGHLPLTEAETEKFSCQNLVSDRTPPTFLWHTCGDPAVPVANTLFYARQLDIHHVPFEVHIFPYGGHGMSTASDLTCDGLTPEEKRNGMWLDCAGSWLKCVFKM